MRQKDDSGFIDLLNNVRVGELNSNDESMIRSRLITRGHPDYPIDSLHLFAENASVHLHNIQRLDTLPSETINVEAMDVYPRDFTESQITKVKNLPLNDTGGLSVLFDLKIGARVMLISNIDIEDRLINGQLGTVTDIKFRNNKAELIYFPLKLAYACTVHKVQGLTLDSVVVSFDLARQRQFNAGQMYVAMSRVKNLNGLYFTGQYRRSAFVCSDKVSEEYTRLRQNKVERVADIMRCSSNLNVCKIFKTTCS
ncbi:ATP-dependent DNA helicase PIF1-like [Clytia hemisphaerica]|uniref:ATP-dependent DNA helicase PIF1-like n=1 Tax=Clytia hemisphaerica TaxID=252671 RepID=UPI0034D7B8FC